MGQSANDASFTIELQNDVNMVWSGPLYVGSPMQGSAENKFIFDTAGPFTAITLKDCSTCAVQHYNPQDSSTMTLGAGNWNITASVIPPNYLLNGTTVSDKVCLDSSQDKTCLSDFGFFSISAFSDMEGDLSAPKYAGSLSLATYNSQNGPSFVAQLKAAGKISEAIVSF